MTDAYRSYVVRVRQQRDDGPGIRVELEDLFDGARALLHGAEALAFADRMRLLVQPAAKLPDSRRAGLLDERHAHDVEAAIDVDDLAGHRAREV